MVLDLEHAVAGFLRPAGFGNNDDKRLVDAITDSLKHAIKSVGIGVVEKLEAQRGMAQGISEKPLPARGRHGLNYLEATRSVASFFRERQTAVEQRTPRKEFVA